MAENDKNDAKTQLKEKLPGVQKIEVEAVDDDQKIKKELELDNGEVSISAEPASKEVAFFQEKSATLSEEERKKLLPEVKKAIAFLTDTEVSEVAKAKNVDGVGRRTASEKTEDSEFLDRQIRELSKGSEAKSIGAGLLKVRNLADKLNSRTLDLRSPRSFLERVTRKTFGENPLTKYLSKFESHSQVIKDTIAGLMAGAKRLEGNNMVFYGRKRSSRALVNSLKLDVAFIKLTVQTLEEEMPTIKDPDVRLFLQQEIIPFFVDRARALEELRAVKNSSIFNDELMIRMNRRAINSVRNVDTTIEALKTAIVTNLAIMDLEQLQEAMTELNIFTSEINVENARRQGQLIQEMTKEEAAGLIFDKLVEAHQITLQNIDNFVQAVNDITERSKEKIEKLGALNAEMEKATERMEKGSEKLLSLKEDSSQDSKMGQLFEKWNINI